MVVDGCGRRRSGLRVFLVLLQRSHYRLQHVTHHLEARVHYEVYKTYTRKQINPPVRLIQAARPIRQKNEN